MDEKEGGGFDLPRSWMKKKEEDERTSGLAYFMAFVVWTPLAVTIIKFWWDFFSWLFI